MKNLPATGEAQCSIPGYCVDWRGWSEAGRGRSPAGGTQPTPVFLPGRSHGLRAWRATVSRVAKSQTDAHTEKGVFPLP